MVIRLDFFRSCGRFLYEHIGVSEVSSLAVSTSQLLARWAMVLNLFCKLSKWFSRIYQTSLEFLDLEMIKQRITNMYVFSVTQPLLQASSSSVGKPPEPAVSSSKFYIVLFVVPLSSKSGLYLTVYLCLRLYCQRVFLLYMGWSHTRTEIVMEPRMQKADKTKSKVVTSSTY